MAEYEEGNAYVARKYLHREDGRLFYEPVRSSEMWKPQTKELLYAAVQTFSATDIYLYQQLQEAEVALLEIKHSWPMKLYRKLRKRFGS